jgi:N-acetylmuramoyl-L-alanine amidase
MKNLMLRIVTLTLLALIGNPVWAKFSQNQVVAAVIVAEAGGEGEVGMRAVASVINNRARESGQSAHYVVTRPHQFDGYWRHVKAKMRVEDFVINMANHPRWAYAMLLARHIDAGTMPDYVNGAKFFHNQSLTPYWAKRFRYSGKIGNHLFYCN